MADKPRILLIDDDRVFVDNIIVALKNLYIIDYAYSFSEGESKIKHKYDLLLIDLYLEDVKQIIDGKELIKIARRYQKETAIIVISENTNIKLYEKIKKLGVDGYIQKVDLDYQELHEMMETLLAGK